MRTVNLNPKNIEEAVLAMSNAYYNFIEAKSPNAQQTFELEKAWSDASKNYRKFKSSELKE